MPASRDVAQRVVLHPHERGVRVGLGEAAAAAEGLLLGLVLPHAGQVVPLDLIARAGTATVTATGIGAYAATASTTFKINPAKLTSANLAYTKATYADKALKPKVSGVAAGKLSVSSSDYTVAYSNNVNVGTAKVIVAEIRHPYD